MISSITISHKIQILKIKDSPKEWQKREAVMKRRNKTRRHKCSEVNSKNWIKHQDKLNLHYIMRQTTTNILMKAKHFDKFYIFLIFHSVMIINYRYKNIISIKILSISSTIIPHNIFDSYKNFIKISYQLTLNFIFVQIYNL